MSVARLQSQIDGNRHLCQRQPDPLEATTGQNHEATSWYRYLGACLLRLDYKNMRPKYVDAISDIINWDTVDARFERCLQVNDTFIQ